MYALCRSGAKLQDSSEAQIRHLSAGEALSKSRGCSRMIRTARCRAEALSQVDGEGFEIGVVEGEGNLSGANRVSEVALPRVERARRSNCGRG